MAPLSVILVCSVVCGIALITGLGIVTKSPRLGVSWVPNTHSPGLRITNVDIKSKNSILKIDDVIVAFKNTKGEIIEINNMMMLREPGFLPTFDKYNEFFKHQERLYNLLNEYESVAILSDHSTIHIRPRHSTSMAELDFRYWTMNLCGIFAFLFGVGVWSFRRGDVAARLFALSGLGYMCSILCASIYTSRELAINPDWFLYLSMLNHFGNLLFTYSLCALLWYTPKRLGLYDTATAAHICLLLIWLNNFFQFFETPIHAFYLILCIPIIFGLIFSVIQWRRTKNQGLERAALKWILLPILIGIHFITILYFIPYLYEDHVNQISSFIGYGIVFCAYIGLVFGIVRYKLFRLEAWWFKVWLLLLGSTLILVIDFFIAYILNVNRIVSLGVTLLVSGWIYFPLRQWTFNYFLGQSNRDIYKILPELIEIFAFPKSNDEVKTEWKSILSKIFSPTTMFEHYYPYHNVHIDQNGQRLFVPMLDSQQSICLEYPNKGGRLFVQEDKQLAESILSAARKSIELYKARQLEVVTERKRIMSDLHDDVCSKLWTISKQAPTADIKRVADDAQKALRDTIYCINQPSSTRIEDALAEWRIEILDITSATSVSLNWVQNETLPSFTLMSRQRVNLGRVIHEAVVNSLRHSNTSCIDVIITNRQPILEIVINDYGNVEDIKDWNIGTGIRNIRSRMAELNGTVEWHYSETDINGTSKGVSVVISFPWMNLQ